MDVVKNFDEFLSEFFVVGEIKYYGFMLLFWRRILGSYGIVFNFNKEL